MGWTLSRSTYSDSSAGPVRTIPRAGKLPGGSGYRTWTGTTDAGQEGRWDELVEEFALPASIAETAISIFVGIKNAETGAVYLDRISIREKENQGESVTLHGNTYYLQEYVPANPPLEATGEMKRSGFAVFVPPSLEAVNQQYIPGKEELGEEIRTFAAQGEEKAVTFVLHALETSAGLRVEWDDLQTAAGDALRLEASDFKRVKHWRQKVSHRSFKVHVIPELLVDLPASLDLEAGRNTQVWLRIRVPDDAEPGEYTGQVRLVTGTGPVASIPLSVRVLPFRLVAPAGRTWGLYIDWKNLMRLFDRETVGRILREVRRFGLNSMVLTPPYDNTLPNLVNYDRWAGFVELAREAGLTGQPWVVKLLSLGPELEASIGAGPDAAAYWQKYREVIGHMEAE